MMESGDRGLQPARGLRYTGETSAMPMGYPAPDGESSEFPRGIAMRESELDAALDALVRHLPKPLRKDWVVVPRRGIHKVAVASMLLGGAIAVLVVALLYGIQGLVWIWPITLVCIAIACRYLPWWSESAFLDQLREARARQEN